jgi:hypothetical protein
MEILNLLGVFNVCFVVFFYTIIVLFVGVTVGRMIEHGDKRTPVEQESYVYSHRPFGAR